ncbi:MULTISPECIES: hypothetical protein [unclassified Caballeronia]|uniref:hypothetical protein n=1 Tax=unclassified Caballeronia TaxID=2646786 RepID=UPI002028AA81|nr:MULTISPECIES: hypothetical protein [unclassified Caballeronia]MDR5765834.1 hypothetical protein [Caballeronia sp. LZ028]
MPIFYQKEDSRHVHKLEIPEHVTLIEIVRAVSGGVEIDLKVFEEDGDVVLTEEMLIEVVRSKPHPKLHFHRQHELKVTVHFNGREMTREAPPSMTIHRLKHWADDKFGIDAMHAAEHVLQVSGTTERPAASVHLGTLTPKHQHHVSFDLVPNERFQG